MTIEKKSERMEVRLGYAEKQAFVEACETQGDTPSGAVRRFIKGYSRRADGDILSSVWRGAFRRRVRAPLLIACGLTVAVVFGMVGWTVFSHAELSDDALFALRDINQDGELDASEHGLPALAEGVPNGVLLVLDLDGSGTLSRQEFISRGRMAYMIQGPMAEMADGHARPSMKEGAIVEFDFEETRTVSGTFAMLDFNARQLDRLVVWHEDGTHTLMQGPVDVDVNGRAVPAVHHRSIRQ